LEHLEIISNLESEEISDKLSDVLERAKEEKINEVEKEAISADQASAQIKKAEDEIAKAEGIVGTLSEEEYGGRAARKLLDLAKKHLEEAKKAFSEGKYGRAFGLATASYHEALNAERIVQKIGEMKKSPEKMKEKFEKLYPEVELPEDVTKCEIPLMKKCAEGEVLRVEKDENGCPIFKCEAISKKPGKEKPEVCIQVWDPVCGKDEKTYSNDCMARAAGVEVDYKGVCRKEKITECILSLCDCKCYPKGETPEEKTGKLCGINCYGIYGISGCVLKEGKCEVVKKSTPPSEEKTGIKEGDWVKYSVPSMTLPEGKIFDWVRIEIKKIEGEKITELITNHYKDGSTETETRVIDISKEADYVASPNLKVGDQKESAPPGGVLTVKKF
jgi:hypothetical protein